MIKITDLIVDAKTLGRKLLLVDVAPAYVYLNGVKTDEVAGHKYTVVCPERNFEKQTIKIEGAKRCESPNGGVECTFDGLELFVYWTPAGYQLGARATDIRLKNQSA